MATNAGTGDGTNAGQPTAPVFVRRSSGLVRDVSPLNALFFSMAAAFGGGIGFTFQNMTATGQPVWQLGLTAYAWSVIFTAGACVLLGLLYAVLNSAMPRAGANYVFTSRIVHPFMAWVESWCFVVALIAVIAVLTPLALLMLNYGGTVMMIAYPDSSTWSGAPGWFTNSDSQFFAGSALIICAGLFAILPTRIFYKALTVFGFLALITVVLMLVVTPFLSQSDFLQNVKTVTGQTPDQIIKAGAYPSGDFTFLAFMGMCSFALFALVGFQYSAFISGEMSGSVKRGTYISILGALAICAFAASFYNDILADKFGLELTKAWGFLFWTGGAAPGGIIGSPPTMGAVANPDLWPIWGLCAIIAFVFTFLLMPVWLVVASRVILAWSMDRQAPEWLGRVNARTNAPLNAIVLCALVSEVVLYLSAYQGLKLGAALWYSILLFSFAWVMPGINALLAKRRRPDLFAEVPSWLPIVAIGWLIAILMIYVFAIFKPLYEGVTNGTESASSYLSSSGVNAALITLAVGIGLYFVNVAWNRSRGVAREQVFTTIPPD